MTTLEKLFMQIFERKDSIIEQLQQQADLYTQQLASRLVIDGITPPPWLLSPNYLNPNGLEKEEIISKLLLRPPPDSIRYSIGGRSLYYPPVVPGENINRQLSTEKCTETHAPNKAVDLINEHVVTLECRKNDKVGILDHVPGQDDSAKSPQSEMDARITSIYAAPDMSLARIQKSKSRQKARELRTGGKTTAKSRLNNENRTHISFSGESKSKKDFHHVIQDTHPSDMSKWNNISVAEEGNDEKGNDGTSHKKIGSSFDKEQLDDDIIVEPTGESLQQSCRVNDVIEGANLPDVCLGSYASKKSITGKLQGTKSQNNRFSGRITRSRSSRLQTSGINQSSKPGTSFSRNPKGAGALFHSVGDSMQSNKLKDAAKNSQVLSDINVETQAICGNEGLLKPVVSSYIDMNESLLGGKHQKNAEIEGNGSIDEPVAMQPVNSGNNLDPITLRQSSNSCMNVIPKQLNFDEIDKGDLNEVFTSLSKKRKLDEMSGKACYSSKEFAPSIDHESSCNVIEQQLPQQYDMSSGTETTRAHSYNNIDELAKDEMKNTDVDMNDNHPVMDDVEHDDIDETCDVKLSLKEVNNKFDKEKHSETSHLNEDQASSLNIQTEEDDLDHKDKESAAGVYMPVSNIKSSLTSSLTKQGNNSFEDRFDKKVNEPEVDLEVGSIPKLSNMKLNSAKANTWPLNQQKDVEDQPNCFSDSRNFRVHIQRDGIRCDLESETPENGSNLLKGSASILSSEKIHLIQADGMQSSEKRDHYEMNCDLLEGTQSLLETQAAEEIVTEVDDDTAEITDTLEQALSTCVVNLIKNVATDDSTYSLAADVAPTHSIINGDVAVTDNNNFEINLPEWVSSPIDDNTKVVSDKITPVYEGLITYDETGNVNVGINEGGIDFDTLEIPSTTIERASIIEQLCKSASMQTPLSQFSPSFTQHQVEDLYGFMADGILDHVDLGTSVSVDEDSRKNPQHQKFDCATPLYYQSKNHYSSPVGKLWERSASSSGSSEVQMSSNPDLTCFPIEEDPSGNEENEDPDEMHDELQENIGPDEENENPVTISTEMKIERRQNDDDVAVANHISMSSMKYADRYSSNSVSMEVSVPRTRDKVKYKPKIPHGIKVSRYEEDNRNSSIATRASSRGNLSVNSKNKSGMRNGIPRLSQKEAKRNNIVSNIASFIPMVQQKQATAACTGKRDIKVKALEAAEAAKRREQEKENERKLKKEALKLERERIGKENAKEMELKLKKQEELKKKEAEIAARKRQREEEERKQLVKKRKLVAEAQKNQKLKNEKSRLGKLEPEKHVKNAAVAGNKKNNKNADEGSFQKQDTGLKIDKSLATVVQQVTSVPENRDASNDCGENDKATSVNEMSPVKVVPVKLTSQENSYDLSPYQCSDDEDDDEDDPPIKKFVPSWASKNRVAMVLPLQQKLNPELIFSVDSFCSMDEVLLPRRQQAQ